MKRPILGLVAGAALMLAPQSFAQTASPSMGATTAPAVGANTPAAAGGREGGPPPAALNMEGVPQPVQTPPAAREGTLETPPSNLGSGAIGAPVRERAAQGAVQGDVVDREVFTDQTRTAISSFYRGRFEQSGACPPGFAKGANTCAPDSRTVRTARVGEAVPASITLEPVPAELVTMLPAPPPGLVYGYASGQVILYELDTRKVADVTTIGF